MNQEQNPTALLEILKNIEKLHAPHGRHRECAICEEFKKADISAMSGTPKPITSGRVLANVSERQAAAVFPSTLLPRQYVKCGNLDGEKRLMLSVLEDALDVYLKYRPARDSRGRQLFCEAHNWIFDKDVSRFFSFQNVCTALGINPEEFRKALPKQE